MADYLAGFVPDFVENEEPRQVILDLGKMITNRIPVKLGFQKLESSQALHGKMFRKTLNALYAL